MNWPTHGANPHYLYEAMNISLPDRLIDFSANINPLGPPSFIQERWSEYFEQITQYPDPEGLLLKQAISEQEQLPKDMILIGNGGAELISLLGRMLAGKKVMIVQPAFSEYEQACKANRCEIVYHQLAPMWEMDPDAMELEDVDAVFICTPNNPTGVCFSYQKIKRLAERCQEKEIFLIVDEAFYDFWQDYESLVPLLKEFPKLILLRSMTKMFAIPGLRLGYLLAHQSILQVLAIHQPHWSVNGIALAVGEACLKEKEFMNQTFEQMDIERKKIFSFLKQEGFVVSPSKVNFYLLQDPQLQDQLPLFEFLLRRGIVPRHTMNFPGLEGKWLRFAIKREAENDILLQALKEWRI